MKRYPFLSSLAEGGIKGYVMHFVSYVVFCVFILLTASVSAAVEEAEAGKV
jgi:hypothetical protein